jgi:hypothetical protein
VPHKSNLFFFCNGSSQKKVELWRLPKIKDSMERWSVSPWAHLYRWGRGGLWAKHNGLKPGAIGRTLGEHIVNLGNILGTWWELIGNLKGTFWKQRKNEKSSPSPPPPNNDWLSTRGSKGKQFKLELYHLKLINQIETLPVLHIFYRYLMRSFRALYCSVENQKPTLTLSCLLPSSSYIIRH